MDYIITYQHQAVNLLMEEVLEVMHQVVIMVLKVDHLPIKVELGMVIILVETLLLGFKVAAVVLVVMVTIIQEILIIMELVVKVVLEDN